VVVTLDAPDQNQRPVLDLAVGDNHYHGAGKSAIRWKWPIQNVFAENSHAVGGCLPKAKKRPKSNPTIESKLSFDAAAKRG